ncbi:hypothetical protein [Photobacterium kishitanii]|uniref:Uncharacterized protein n=1 Tax=Photobacterium kishitanii TaxID=318456 RepID=A0A2T3KAY8_9GAMM|nr:hypothetical protein [Photobacterium kishitanii]PSU89791.1 hypothetical protein C9J27_24220 [Photobacterium kishitanii]
MNTTTDKTSNLYTKLNIAGGVIDKQKISITDTLGNVATWDVTLNADGTITHSEQVGLLESETKTATIGTAELTGDEWRAIEDDDDILEILKKHTAGGVIDKQKITITDYLGNVATWDVISNADGTITRSERVGSLKGETKTAFIGTTELTGDEWRRMGGESFLEITKESVQPLTNDNIEDRVALAIQNAFLISLDGGEVFLAIKSADPEYMYIVDEEGEEPDDYCLITENLDDLNGETYYYFSEIIEAAKSKKLILKHIATTNI